MHDALTQLHDTYIGHVNRAVAGDRPELAEELAAAYTDDALRLIVSAEGQPPASA